MFAWFRRIRRFNIFGFELEFNHPVEVITTTDGGAGGGETQRGRRETEVINPPPPKAVKTVPPGARFTTYGTVIRTVGRDLGLRARNEPEVREFWRANEIETKLDWFGPGPPVFSIGRAQDIKKCRVGDEASLTFEVVDRAAGKRGIQTVGFEVRSRS
jgi:hypothetical protein